MSGATTPAAPTGPKDTPIRGATQGGILLVPWESGMAAGSGYDTVTRTILSTAGVRDFRLRGRPAVGEDAGQYVQLKVQQVETLEKMHEVLQFGTDFHVGYDAFSANNIGRFLHEVRTDSYSLYFVIRCFIQNTEFRLDGFQLARGKDRLGDAEFRRGHGDYFVNGYVTGGYLIGLAEVQATTRQALDKIKEEIGAQYNRGPLSVDGGFAANWEKWVSTSGLNATLEVIYAGMNGADLKTVPQALPTPVEPVLGDHSGGANHGGRGSPARPIRVKPENLVARDEDDDDDSDDDDEEDGLVSDDAGALRRNAELPAPSGSTAAPAKPPPRPQVEHLSAGLSSPAPNYERVQMTMQGLLGAAAELPRQALTHGVPLYAILECYSPNYRGSVGELNIESAEYEHNRTFLNQVYLKAARVEQSVTYALSKSGQFAAKEAELKKVQARMIALRAECEQAARRLKENALFTLPASIVLPSDADIPDWIIEKTPFDPFGGTLLSPKLFCNIFDEAVTAALAQPNKSARPRLKAYLMLVLEKIVDNYRHAYDALTAIAGAFPVLDYEMAHRSDSLKDLAAEVDDLKKSWKRDSAEVKARFVELEGKSGLDAAGLDFLKWVNALLFGPDEAADKQLYGFASFWTALHTGLVDLAKARQWDELTGRFGDLVDFGGSKRWSDHAASFRTEAAALDTEIRNKLAKL